MRTLLTMSCVALALALIPLAPASADPVPRLLERINGQQAFDWAQELAGPAYRGRGTGEEEIFQAISWIEERWRDWGIQPVTPGGSFRQPFTVTLSRVTGPTACSLLVPGQEVREYVDAEDYQPFPYGGPEPVEADVVFVGYGIHAPDLGYDDYAGIDVKGKIVFLMRHAPNHEDRFGEHATFVKKAQTAHEKGAVGAILVTDPNGHDSFTPLDFPSAALALPGPFAAVFLHTRYAEEWFAPSGQLLTALQAAIDESGRPLSFPLGVRAALHVPTVHDPERTTYNAVGWLPGSDPKLAQEVIVLGAHLDHLGARGDRIYPGADDNGSGTVALLQVAQAWASKNVRPKRSVLFIHFSGEEMGLLGSKHYVEDPWLPPGHRKIAMLNMDMVGLGNGGVTTLTPKTGNSDRLTQLAEVVRGRYLNADLPQDRLFYGTAQDNSDHAPFANSGIPALFFVSSGSHPDYHQPGDTPEKLDAAILARCARLCAGVAWELAERGVPRQALAWEVTDPVVYHAHADEE